MGKALRHIPVKLIIGLIFEKPSQFSAAERSLQKKFGKTDKETRDLDFTYTDYYEEEFGTDLKRKFISFKGLISLEKTYKLKLCTEKIERKFSKNNRRSVNIDPGYMSLSHLVMLTTKPGSHRIYLSAGIYADLELVYVRGAFRPFEWTYPDYRSKDYIDFFNSVRADYHAEVKCLLKEKAR
ncbi:MAG: DUF4416 family protein [Omnitrophica bacterium]|nr:DUF4416 family protein [Candidatus Omnitrophota bacterium]